MLEFIYTINIHPMMVKCYKIDWITLLERVDNHAWASCNELAEDLGVKYWEVYRALKRLEYFGYIEREVTEPGELEGNTKILYSITTKGREYYNYKVNQAKERNDIDWYELMLKEEYQKWRSINKTS